MAHNTHHFRIHSNAHHLGHKPSLNPSYTGNKKSHTGHLPRRSDFGMDIKLKSGRDRGMNDIGGELPGQIIVEEDEDDVTSPPMAQTVRGLSIRPIADDLSVGLASTGRGPMKRGRGGMVKQASIKKPRGVGMVSEKLTSWKKDMSKQNMLPLLPGDGPPNSWVDSLKKKDSTDFDVMESLSSTARKHKAALG